MKWIGQHIWDLTSRFRNDIYFEGLAETAETRGLVVDADGKVSINSSSGDEHATHVYENVRNDEGATIPAGTPVYSKGEIGGSERINVGIADASDPAKMPAIGITNTELTTTGDTKDGLITLVGVYNTNISGFTGLSENDIVYVASGGGLTTSKPAGTNLIQNVGIILKTNGAIIQGLAVTCIGRTNDIPNSLQLRKTDGTNAGLISMTGNDMVLSNATGDVLIGSTTYQVGGDQDIFIGDGTNSVDLIFEQPGSIRGYDSSANLTIGGGGGTITFADAVEFTNDITVSSLNYASSRGWVEDSQPMYSQTGFYGGDFIRNGDDSENETVWGLDPFGNKGLLWKAIQGQTDDSADGGWNKDIAIPANNNVGYISYVYFKIDFTPDSSSDGQFYHGCGTNAGQTISLAGVSNTNPYFNSGAAYELGFGGTPIEANKWYVSVGILQAYNNSTTDTETVAGIYEVDTGKKVRSGNEFKMGNNTTSQKHRTYWYYSRTSDVQNAYFWGPGFHAIDGTEPKIQDLVKSVSFSESYQAGRDAQNFIDFTTDNAIKFTTNSSEALRIDSSGRVGINTTSPSSELEVVGNGANGIVLGEDPSNSTLSSRLFFANATSNQGVTLLNSDGGLAIFTGATPGNTSGTEKIKMSSTGRLGINTSSPSKMLHVNGDTLLDGDLTVNGTNYGLYHATYEDYYYSEPYTGTKHLAMFIKNARADIIRYGSVGSLEYWNGSSWVDGSAEIANLKKLLDGRQDTRWNVPSTYYKFRFSVYPSTAWPTRTKIGIQTGWSGSTWPGATMLVEEYDGSNWATKVTADFGGQAGGSATPLNSNDNDVNNWGLMFKADDALHTGNGNNTNYNSGLNTRITIDFYGWSPSNPSHVTIPLQNIFITSNYAGTENTDYTNLLDYDRNVAIPNAMTVAGNTTMSGRVDIEKDLRLRGSSDLANQGVARLYVDSSDRLFIDTANDGNNLFTINDSGKVGIGTTSPTSALHVVGTQVYAGYVKFENTVHAIRLDLRSASHTANIYMDGTGGVISGGGFIFNAPTARTHFMESGTPKMSIISGNVGIGTSSPSKKLHVNGDVLIESTNPALFFTDTNADSDYSIKVNGGVLNVRDETNDAARISLKSDGNVGIGNTSPNYKLDVDGTSRVAGTIHMYGSVRNYSGDFSLHNGHQDSDILFKVNDGGVTTTAMAIDGATSNVGIGTTSPSEKLEVNGKIKATNINFSGLPTSSTGLSAGDVWDDNGTLKIVR